MTPQNSPLRAILWCAVSTIQQLGNEEDPKISLPKQEEDGRALSVQYDWRIIDVLRVPGHSRYYLDLHECAADMRSEGIDAFDRLIDHLRARDFDVFICRDSERFARSQSLHARITEEIIRAGARIYSFADGFIDQTNHRMFIAMAGYKAASDIDRLVRARTAAMDKRAERGLPTSSSTPLSHIIIRDERGRALRREVDESKRRLWDDLAALLIEGVGWHHLEQELYNRFGHVDTDGKPYRVGCFYNLVNNPIFWGHSGRHYNDPNAPEGIKRGLWIFDDSEPVPEGVTIHRDTHPAVWTGEQAERVKAELRRRSVVIRGSARPRRTYRFTGLCVCGECGYYMVVATGWKTYVALDCNSRDMARHNPNRPDCSQTRQINFTKIQTYIDGLLRAMLAAADPDLLSSMTTGDTTTDVTAQVIRLQDDITALEQQIRRLILKQSTADERLWNTFDEEIQAATDRLKILDRNLQELKRQTVSPATLLDRQRAYEDIAELSIERFWQLPDTAINQTLHRLMGKRRFVVLEGEIIGIVNAPPSR